MLAARHEQWDTAVEGLTAAVKLLPQLAWHGINRADREDQLGELQGIGASAAAVAIASGDPSRALALLEQGRSVLWNQDLHLRSEHTALAEASPELHATLTSIAVRLAQDTDDRIHLAERWDSTVEEIRALPGFANFLSITSTDVLRRGIGPHPVVVINISPLRSDAIVVGRDSVTTVALPDLGHDGVNTRVETYLTAVARLDLGQTTRLDLVNANQILQDTLEWLWDVMAEPVLRHLGHDGPPTGDWPAVIWSPTGPLALLPVHAAGYHDPDEPGRAVLDWVVSSYTSSVRALTRDNPAPRSRRARDVLIVSVPDAISANLAHLPGARAEADLLARHFPRRTRKIMSGASATRRAVANELANHRGVHFACHGSQELDCPGLGSLHLSDGPLTVRDIASLPLDHAEFAYLSACKTAVGGTKLADESIHLVGALQQAGYRHVIGALWNIHDLASAAVARRTYELMQFDFATGAAALHHAIRELRDSRPFSTMLWASYVHFGPVQ